jgi:hypothetical protein
MHACGNWEGYIIQVARNLVWLDTQSVIVIISATVSVCTETFLVSAMFSGQPRFTFSGRKEGRNVRCDVKEA